MLKQINKDFIEYNAKHGEIHADVLVFSYDIIEGIQITFEIEKRISRKIMNIEEYDELNMHIRVKNKDYFNTYTAVSLKDIYRKVLGKGLGDFSYLLEKNLKPYKIIEKLTNRIQSDIYLQKEIKEMI